MMAVKKLKVGNIDKGLLIYEETSNSVAEKKYLKFNKDELVQYQEKFEILQDDGIIKSTSEFLDHQWNVMGREYYRSLDFTEIEYNKELYFSLKCYVIVQLYDRKISPDSMFEGFHCILNIITLTSCYDKRKLLEFEEWKLEKESSKIYLDRYKVYNLGFLYFNPINDASNYIPLFESIQGADWNAIREIPTYEEFVRFDFLINDFMIKATKYMRSKYYPIFIWWKLSTIIPIRPIELVTIKNNDIRYDAKEEKYYLTKGKRKQSPSKKEKGKHHVAIPHEIQINKEVFEIIEDYRKITNSENEEYLFHLSHHYEHLKMPNRSSFINRGETIIHANHRTTTLMTKLLDSFFDEVIQDGMGINIVNSRDELDLENPHKTITRFNLMDTRHFAICSMMMQGFSELTIAQMAGHNKIETQSAYASHIDDFQRSYSNLLAKDIQRSMTNLNTSGFEHFTFRQKQILSYWNSDYSKEKKIDYGYCQSKNFPYECFEDDCIFCNKIHIDLSNLTTLEQSELANKITKIQDEIQIKLNFIKKYYQSAYRKKESEFDNNEKNSKDLERNSANLAILLNRKAMLEAHLAKKMEVQDDN
ncbi:hypothetical protein RGU12_01915 [Fredinandcohnia sp. QZ13]|uniref:hypothetical protein n=1 Tax=Fredinandcohnia sp. QZ13 TaxID=3073144 RepID=UPI002853256C|nr:hypothetical protein [Fredinandcohnia sp. QZ13]MDR4886300.1 hypothetical protein [Fredinandcohnia sp. QZ13]